MMAFPFLRMIGPNDSLHFFGFMIDQSVIHMPKIEQNEVYFFLFPAFDLNNILWAI